jgi:hypothetical protein
MTPDGLREAALRYVADRAIQYLLQVGEPAKTGQITGFVSEETPISGKVVRDALTLDPRFVQRERRWDLMARDIDTHHPLERTIADFLLSVGRPLFIETVGVEIAKATGISPEAETETVRRLAVTRPRFRVLPEDRLTVTEWLLDTSDEDADDVLFANFDDETELDELSPLAEGLNWSDPAAAATELITKAARPVSGKVMAFLAFESQPEGFDGAEFHQCLLKSDLTLGSDGMWLTPALVSAFVPVWDQMADEPPVEGAPEEASRPAGEVAITPSDMEEIAAIVRRVDGLITSRQILEQVMEVSPSDADYRRWEQTLAAALAEQGELISVGWDRWRKLESIPTTILDAPETLNFQTFSFHTLEGEELDVELSVDGLDGKLADQVSQPLAAMGGQCVPQKDGSARCTVSILHNISGTLPVGGDKPFFPAEPAIIEATITGPNGRFSLWVNNMLGLAFGLDEVYALLPESGGVFVITPANRPGEYRLEIQEGLDPLIGIEESRLKELRNIAARKTFAETSTFDLVGEFLERHRKGADFHTILAEMWVIRPASANLIASLLSGYYCFKQNKNGTWSFDPREVDKGFKKAKRKYVV